MSLRPRLRISIFAIALAAPCVALAMDPIGSPEAAPAPSAEPAPPARTGRPAKTAPHVRAPQPAAPEPREATARSLIGDWRGFYACTGNLTGLTLTIDRQSGSQFAGYFHFYPPRVGSPVAEGCYAVEGRVAANGAVGVHAAGWISQPPGYVTVDLTGRLNGSGRAMTGQVLGPFRGACARFAIQAVSTGPEPSGACRR